MKNTVPKGRVHHDEEDSVTRRVFSVAVRAWIDGLLPPDISRSRWYDRKEPEIILLPGGPLRYPLPPARPTSCCLAVNSKTNLLHGGKTSSVLKRGEIFHPLNAGNKQLKGIRKSLKLSIAARAPPSPEKAVRLLRVTLRPETSWALSTRLTLSQTKCLWKVKASQAAGRDSDLKATLRVLSIYLQSAQ